MNFKYLLGFESDEIINPGEKTIGINKEINKLKNEIQHFLSESGIDINDISDFCHLQLKTSSELFDDMVVWQNVTEGEAIQDILNSTHELQKISSDLEEVDFSLNILQQLVECDTILKKYQSLKRNCDFLGAVKLLSCVTNLLNNPVEGLEMLALYKGLKTDLVLNWEHLLNDLSAAWSECVHWEDLSTIDQQITCITINSDKVYDKSDLLEALVASKQIHLEIKNFSYYLLKNIFNPLIHNNANIVLSEEANPMITVNISINDKTTPHYDTVLGNLRIVFEFLDKNLSYEMTDKKNLIALIGEFICVDFSDLLIKDCLVQTIPNHISKMIGYDCVTSEVEKFQQYLTSINFFEKENFSILQYANNVDVLFANKTIEYFLDNARTIMKKDLGTSISVGTDIEKVDDIPESKLLENFAKAFSVSPFCFPHCTVSLSTQELLDLVTVMMKNGYWTSDLYSRRLYFTARNIFELYIAIVPLHFKTNLETAPLDVALFHNNCMYLAHNLLTLGPRLQKIVTPAARYNITFCDLVKELRDLATDKLLNYMRIQRKQTLDTIRASDLHYIATKDSLGESAEQSVRQCLRQLQLLKTLWSGVFPYDIYRRLISCLANVFVEELILKVVLQEDITADVACQLSEIYKIVVNRLPQIYQDPGETHTNITQWQKFNELILVLNGTLADIEERWFNGMGPLALQFKPDEIKRLIRALFQNTTFRANILSKIK